MTIDIFLERNSNVTDHFLFEALSCTTRRASSAMSAENYLGNIIFQNKRLIIISMIIMIKIIIIIIIIMFKMC